MSQISKIQVSGSLYDIKDKYARTQIQNLKNTNNSESNDLVDYTAFEVFPHDYEIPVGECEELGGYVTNAIAPFMGHHMAILTSVTDVTEMDGVIDWGDGTIEKMSDILPEYIIGGVWHFTHLYTESGKKYIVKVYGNKINGIRTGGFYQTSAVKAVIDTTKYSSLICRVLDYDLPINPKIVNWSGFAGHSKHLINVDISSSLITRYALHADNLFYNCRNLLSITGYTEYFSNIKRMSSPIAYCMALKTTDFKFPSVPYAFATFAYNCPNLEMDILDFFPRTFVLPNTKGLNVSSLFKGDSKLGLGKITINEDGVNNTYIINQTFYDERKSDAEIKAQMDVILAESANKLGKFFWNNKNVMFESYADAFLNCSKLLRSYIPASWGGAGDDSILIEKSDKEKIVDLESRLQILEAYINNNPDVIENTLEFE